MPKIKLSSHQGLWPAFLRRLAATLSHGSNIAKLKSPAKKAKIKPKTKLIIAAKRVKYQNSSLPAVPSKAMYFLVTMLTKYFLNNSI